MRLIISKIVNVLKNKKQNIICNYYQWLPQSLNETCNCKKECKFPPKGKYENIKLQINY